MLDVSSAILSYNFVVWVVCVDLVDEAKGLGRNMDPNKIVKLISEDIRVNNGNILEGLPPLDYGSSTAGNPSPPDRRQILKRIKERTYRKRREEIAADPNIPDWEKSAYLDDLKNSYLNDPDMGWGFESDDYEDARDDEYDEYEDQFDQLDQKKEKKRNRGYLY